MDQIHDRAVGAGPPRPPRADVAPAADPDSGSASRRTAAGPATRDFRLPAPYSPQRADREPLGAVEAYYAQPTLQHTPSFY
jgi:hypothetical protein